MVGAGLSQVPDWSLWQCGTYRLWLCECRDGWDMMRWKGSKERERGLKSPKSVDWFRVAWVAMKDHMPYAHHMPIICHMDPFFGPYHMPQTSLNCSWVPGSLRWSAAFCNAPKVKMRPKSFPRWSSWRPWISWRLCSSIFEAHCNRKYLEFIIIHLNSS